QASRFPMVGIKKLCLIPLGIETPVFMSIDGSKHVLGKNIGVDISKKTIVGVIAELNSNKGLNYLIEAFVSVVHDHPNSVCLIIGDGEENANLNMLIKQHKLEQNVFLIGYLDHAAQYLKAFS